MSRVDLKDVPLLQEKRKQVRGRSETKLLLPGRSRCNCLVDRIIRITGPRQGCVDGCGGKSGPRGFELTRTKR
jgi:hypothetical protein